MPYTFDTTMQVPCEINMYDADGCEDVILNASFTDWKDNLNLYYVSDGVLLNFDDAFSKE